MKAPHPRSAFSPFLAAGGSVSTVGLLCVVCAMGSIELLAGTASGRLRRSSSTSEPAPFDSSGHNEVRRKGRI